MKRGSVHTGFTLVEVMVALAIVAIALPALVFAYLQYVDSTGYLRDKLLATQVVENKWAEVQLLNSEKNFNLDGEQRGQYELAERTWYWRLKKEKTEVDGFFRYELSVSQAEEDEFPLQTQIFFLRGDVQ
ncbi:MAG: type secretion system protein GspI [Pseudomonadota bacterium]